MNIKPQVSKFGESDEKRTNVNPNLRTFHTSSPESQFGAGRSPSLAAGEEHAALLISYHLAVYFSWNPWAGVINIPMAQKFRPEGVNLDRKPMLNVSALAVLPEDSSAMHKRVFCSLSASTARQLALPNVPFLPGLLGNGSSRWKAEGGWANRSRSDAHCPRPWS